MAARLYVPARSRIAKCQLWPGSKDARELNQWAYTAITRAKDTVRFLTQHTFTAPHERTSMATPSRTPKTLADPFLLETPTPDAPRRRLAPRGDCVGRRRRHLWRR